VRQFRLWPMRNIYFSAADGDRRARLVAAGCAHWRTSPAFQDFAGRVAAQGARCRQVG